VTESPAIGLFQAFGIELEYMIVDCDSLAVRPVADALISAEAGSPESEIARGEAAWSNELARHLIELKTNGPAPSLAGLAGRFEREVRHILGLLAPLGARLMPTAMHPTMDPSREFERWPHEHGEVYAALDRIFDCRGPGWANLQSAHLNLPFAGDEEFGRLHTAVRALLPALPALAASSPLVAGRPSGLLDTRLEFYRTNARRVPSVTGLVIPEPVFTRADYEREILAPIYADLAPLDPDGILRHEWVNARGAIARFDRSAIEIRVLDVQECPAADLAIAALVVAVLRNLTGAEGERREALRKLPTERLARILADATARADAARIEDGPWLAALGLPEAPICLGDAWRRLAETHLETDPPPAELVAALDVILCEGPLARRILARLGGDARPERVRDVYLELCACLSTGRVFRARG
jgi:glutamate---cysteine ligase / carboxylate-amine ligase